jgi:hypothetical protein
MLPGIRGKAENPHLLQDCPFDETAGPTSGSPAFSCLALTSFTENLNSFVSSLPCLSGKPAAVGRGYTGINTKINGNCHFPYPFLTRERTMQAIYRKVDQ